MGIKQDVFGLEQIYRLQVEGQWSTRGDVWLSPSPFFTNASAPTGYDTGYFGGGSYPAVSTVDRIDYSNDTATAVAKGPLTAAGYSLDATGNQSFGYYGGGTTRGSTTDRIDYSNDTATATQVGALQVPSLTSYAATGNASFGYFGGGFVTKSAIRRIDYSNDTPTASPKGQLSIGRGSLAATGNQSFGYFGGGWDAATPYLSTVDRVDYSNDTATASVKGPLSATWWRMAATGNSSFGYFGGGNNQSVPGGTSVDRIDYSNDTATASPKGQLNENVTIHRATGNASFGYFGGGHPGDKSTVQRVDYSNDTATASPKGPLSLGRKSMGASGSKDNGNPVKILNPASSPRPNIAPAGTDFGYFGGGYTGSAVLSRVERIDYSNDTTVETKGPLSAARRYFGATGNAFFGYFIGGSDNPSSTKFSTVDRVDYLNDTPTAVAKGPLASVRSNFGATGNADFGYVGGGNPGAVSTVERIDYSNDTAATAPKGPLSAGRYNVTATGNQNFGYFGGGSHPVVSTVDRVDYSNDTVTAVAKGPLSAVKRYHAATGNASFGYFGGGFSSSTSSTISTVDRVDYSNDTATAVAKGPLGTAIERIGATGNTSFGYFAGGQPSHSSANRVDYSNDTATALAKGPLSAARQSLTASSSRANAMPSKGPGILEVPVSFGAFSLLVSQGTDFGYTGGGAYPFELSTTNRIDYSNDTATALVKGPLSSERWSPTAVSSATHGYFIGGGPSSPTPKTTIDRIDYSNDTATAAEKGPLSSARKYGAAAGNSNFGYIAGGDTPSPAVSTVDRIDYSNDTVTTSVKGPLSHDAEHMSGMGNQNFGYFGGGEVPAVSSRVDRIDYSNDTATASPKGPLNSAREGSHGAGNADFGYFMGGGPGTSNERGVARVDYSNDTATALTKGNLNHRRDNHSATGNQSFGYAIAGTGSADRSDIDRVDYSNDSSTAVTKGNMTISPYRYMGATSSRENAIPTTTLVNYAAGTYATPNTGYFAGGTPGPKSTVDRIDYSNDTVAAVVKGSLPPNTQRERGGGTSSGTHGYFAAGLTPASPSSTIVDRVDYVNDTVTLSNKGPLSLSRNAVASVGNANFGYFIGGGSINSPYIYSSMDRVDYSNDVATASIKGQMTGNRTSAAATGNQDFGYIGGGSNTGGSNVDRMDYANDTATALAKGDLSVARSGFLSAAGNASFGYFGGGPSLSSVDRVDYASDTVTASPKGSFTINRYGSAGTGDANFGYFGGGSPGPNSSVDRIDYSNDTATASPKGPLSAARHYLSGTSARENGFVPLGPSVVSNAPVQTGMQDYRGYIFGGQGDPSLSPSANQPTQRIDFLNDTATAVVRGAPAGGNLYYNFAVGNRNYAYAANLGSPSPASVQRFDYSNETAALVVRGAYNTVLIGDSGPTSSVGGYNAAATGNHDYGWTNGGYKLYSVPAPGSGYYSAFSQIDRIDYSNDTANASRRSYTTNRFGTGSATGTNNYGYWIGGSTSMTSYSGTSTKVDRTDYASDTTNAVAKGNLSAIHGGESDSIGNSSYGWVAGGRPYSSTKVDRIDYASDTSTASPKGPLSAAVYSQSTTGSQSYGYFCGGSPGPKSIVQRVDYSNDTVTASPKGPLVYKNRSSSGASTTYNSLPST